MSSVVEVQAVGTDEAVRMFDRVNNNMRDLTSGFRLAMPILAAGEARYFSRLRGKFVDTGRLRESLTRVGSGGDAIREAHRNYAVFGTNVTYARYLRAGRVNKRGTKKSAVLVLLPTERKLVARAMLRDVVGGDD